jgi:glucosamine 6-phosphate synthetase-like amidotransferase/phosphosugar isomerase protein
MCGIVGYLGNAANGLSRVLGAMASILYRAPDSTGCAWFGDGWEPIRVRKTIGALSRFVEALLREGVHPDPIELLLSRWRPEAEPADRRQLQRALLAWEGLPDRNCSSLGEVDSWFPAGETDRALACFEPGSCGDPEGERLYTLATVQDIKRLIWEAIRRYELPPVVTRTLLRKAVVDEAGRRGPEESSRLPESGILEMLDELFERILREERLLVPGPEPEPDAQPTRRPAGSEAASSRSGAQAEGSDSGCTCSAAAGIEGQEGGADEPLWRLLRQTRMVIPSDFNADAIRAVFRLLDGALAGRMAGDPEIGGRVQKILERDWPGAGARDRVDWFALYQVERGLNAYGRAAAAVWRYLKDVELSAVPGGRLAAASGGDSAPALESGRLDPAELQYFCPPIIAHGRWALQSPVSTENAHPFLDSRGQRAIVLNGQFSPAVEDELREFLLQAGFSFRSQNSSEYLSLLWGHYYEQFAFEQRRSETIRAQVDSGLESYSLGSKIIDYGVYSMIKGKSATELDALAFREAVRQISGRGGQIAAAGISLLSPRSLFVACHNRPVFIVRRLHGEELMVVSDINAALGLFSQKMIQERTRELKELRAGYREELEQLRGAGADAQSLSAARQRMLKAEEKLLEPFRVSVLPLEGEKLFARLETVLEQNRIRRRVEVSDFEGQPFSGLEEFETVLDPLQGEKEVFASFFETHLREVPERLGDLHSAYLPGDSRLPQLRVKRRLLVRRFGRKLEGLRRIVLFGAGSSYHAGLMARTLFRRLLPRVEILAARPAEAERILGATEPEKNLAVLLSWSGTTADIVELARELEKSKVALIVITNKPYADLGLVAWRNLGVVNLISGEEVTFSAVKSTFSVLYGADLLALWLARLAGANGETLSALKQLRLLPDSLRRLLDDPEQERTARSWAEAAAGCSMVFVFDDLLTKGTGREIAWKIEENGRGLVSRALDFRCALPGVLRGDPENSLVLVNATGGGRLLEAVELMKRLFLAGVRFQVLSCEQPPAEQVEFLSQGRVLYLPRVDEAFRPFLDLFFYYRFTLHLVEARAKGVAGFPRNRVKSVTTARSRQGSPASPAAELGLLKRELDQIEGLPPPDYTERSAWEGPGALSWERELYGSIRRLARMLSATQPLAELFPRQQGEVKGLVSALFDELGEGGEALFLCLDDLAGAAALDAAAVWMRLLRVEPKLITDVEELQAQEAQLPLLVLATEAPDSCRLEETLRALRDRAACWLGPELPLREAQAFGASLGCFALPEMTPIAAYASLYAGLIVLLTQAWEAVSAAKSGVLRRLTACAEKTVAAVLADGQLRQSVERFWESNPGYRSAFFIGPPSGAGILWERIFDASGALYLQHHLYGDSAHGPIAAVDSRVEEKFVPLGSREEMVEVYGRQRVEEWESRLNRTVGLESLATAGGGAADIGTAQPFYAGGSWYLPVRNPGYDQARDTLVVLDCSWSRYHEQSLDELEVLASRFASLLRVSQQCVPAAAERDSSRDASFGRGLLLPALPGLQADVPIPDLHLPLVHIVLATACAASCLKARGGSERPPVYTEDEEQQMLLRGRFPLLGQALADEGVRLRSLEHRHLAALDRLAPLVTAVEGSERFRVRRISTERQLSEVAAGFSGQDREELFEHFRYLQPQGVPFFMMAADGPPSAGPSPPAGGVNGSSGRPGWREAAGASWEALASGMIEISESEAALPVIELPLLRPPEEEGRLYRLYVRYRGWDYSQPLEEQLPRTVEAMQKGLLALKQQSRGYLTLVNNFNDLMRNSGVSWNDWLVAILPRSWLLYRTSAELARITAHRLNELMEAGGVERSEQGLERIREALLSAWSGLSAREGEDERRCWRELVKAIKKQLRGERR